MDEKMSEILSTQKLTLCGEVVEILETERICLAKISVEPCNVLSVIAPDFGEAHLGDRVTIDARIIVDRVQPGDDKQSKGDGLFESQPPTYENLI
jgi:hypothetical protein